MKRVVLHIGAGKTGTSTIQRALYRSRRRLRRRAGVDYAVAGLRTVDDSGEVIPAHYPVVEALLDNDEARLASVVDYVDKRPEKTVIFSCEDFYHHLQEQHIARLAELFGRYSISVICYVRRQDEYVESAYRQRIKSGYTVEPHDFFARHTDAAHLGETHANYHRMLDVWVRYFGTEAIVLRVFEAGHFHGGSLLRDFLTAAGLPHTELDENNDEHWNEALPAELVAVLRALNEAGVVPREHRFRFIADLRKRFQFEDYAIVTPRTRAKIMQTYADSNRKLFEQFRIAANWEPVECNNNAEDLAVTPRRSEKQLLASLCYESWAARQGGFSPWRLCQEIHYGLRDLLFYGSVRANRTGTPATLARGTYLHLLRRMIVRRLFSPSYYLARNGDVAAQGMDPLEHYLRYGCHEGRIPHPRINRKQARSMAAGVAESGHPCLYDWLNAKEK